jgi:hypothetical protein
MLHLTLDLNDPLVCSFAPFPSIPLLYCMRCVLCQDAFTYRLFDDCAIDITHANLGERRWEDWRQCVGGDAFEERSVILHRLPARLEELYDKYNADRRRFSEADDEELLQISRCYEPWVWVDGVNQVGGRAMLWQPVDDPMCSNCQLYGRESHMWFLATLKNYPEVNLTITFDDTQIIFFYCPECCSVTVMHRCT